MGLHRMNIDSEIEIDAETEIEIETEFVEIDCIVYGWAKETAKRWTGCFHWRKTRTKPRQPAMSEGKRIIENYNGNILPRTKVFVHMSSFRRKIYK